MLLTLTDVCRKSMVALEAERDCLAAGMSLGAENKTGGWIQQAVLVDGLGIEVLTWAGKGNPDAQTYED